MLNREAGGWFAALGHVTPGGWLRVCRLPLCCWCLQINTGIEILGPAQETLCFGGIYKIPQYPHVVATILEHRPTATTRQSGLMNSPQLMAHGRVAPATHTGRLTSTVPTCIITGNTSLEHQHTAHTHTHTYSAKHHTPATTTATNAPTSMFPPVRTASCALLLGAVGCAGE